MTPAATMLTPRQVDVSPCPLPWLPQHRAVLTAAMGARGAQPQDPSRAPGHPMELCWGNRCLQCSSPSASLQRSAVWAAGH